MKAVSSVFGGLLLVLAVLGSSAVYIVDEREQALLFQLGEVVGVKTSPGVYFKIPVAQNVRFFDSRILTMDSEEPERFITSEKKNVLVDLFVKWRIVDVKQYYVSVRGDETLAQTRLAQTINSSMRDEFGNRTVHDVVSGERDKIMEIMRQKANADARKIGVEVVDVRLKRVDLPQEVSESVYRRMEAERKRVANELRSTGAAEAEKIRADADRQHEVILAEAYSEAQKIMGDGDAQATAIYADAFQKDAKFYEFYRSLEAYRKSFKSKEDILVLEPNSEFFKYMKTPLDRKK
ncbi:MULTISPECIES: protease modulator HflC [Nitrosomonas]|uniref:Protein HflC n=1 Tax=Nitrosomonas europaea (strain ATCC 19718 / CIP 103999 / KCTC 2705 / NBRC 14298) TaxID=228410 RepID=Q82V26_NITEU|nr:MULTISPECIES: protease modulator HflC [Nitrosomonas]MCE7917656.1 protease modulator HflC [Nitrosomonas sp. PRO5]MDL1864643.1 protease modulator HflC [Betaproteobacteria bacterium PRO5]KXK49115.1 MAG: Band 7 protein [Nitrosomonas europaea]MBV6390716.1 Modulator of FtsH protease HflC [Nitrosomonas europaea]MEB2331792.1 protease modulator HflC [Nitrosomonas sp.]